MFKMAQKEESLALNILQTMRRNINNNINTSDFIIISQQDDLKFYVHLSVMAASSDYFVNKLGSKVAVLNVNSVELKSIIDYCYGQDLKLSDANVLDFFDAARIYKFYDIERKCIDYMINNNVSPELVLKSLFNTKGYNLSNQNSELIINYLCEHISTLINSDHFQFVEKEFLIALLQNDNLCADEKLVFAAIKNWIGFDEIVRKSSARDLLACVRLEYINKKFLGNDIDSYFNEHDSHDLIYNEYRRRILGSISTKQRRVYNGDIFLVCTADVKLNIYIYKKSENKWKDISVPLPSEVYLRAKPSIVLMKNEIYVLGGSIDNRQTNTVKCISLMSVRPKTLPSMEIARSNFTAIAHNGFIYAIGGLTSENKPVNRCERYEIQTQTWHQIANLNDIRFDYGIAEVNGRIYVAGGGVGKNFYSVEYYDQEINKWIEIASMDSITYDFDLTGCNGLLYNVGTTCLYQRYDPKTDSWTQIAHFTDELIDAENEICCVNFLNCLYVVCTNGNFYEFNEDEKKLIKLQSVCFEETLDIVFLAGSHQIN